jgi:hypothetical protein
MKYLEQGLHVIRLLMIAGILLLLLTGGELTSVAQESHDAQCRTGHAERGLWTPLSSEVY